MEIMVDGINKDEDIKKILVEFPLKIKSLEENMLSDAIEIETIKVKISTMELEIAGIVANEIDETGKAKYSNEMKRKAETDKRLNANDKYIELTKNLSLKEQSAKHDAIKVTYLKNLLRSAGYIVMLTTK
jgi:hypothetical protein